MASMEGSNLAVEWLSLSCLGLVVEYWPFLGTCRRHNYSKLYYCVVLLLYLSFHHHPPHPHIPPTHHLIYAGPILMNLLKNCQKLTKISHYLLARLVHTKANRYLSIMLSEWVRHYQGKAGFFKFNFQNSISKNTSKCELGGLSFRQSHIETLLWEVYEKYSMRGQVKRQIQCKAKASTVFILRHTSSSIFFIQNKHMIINPLIYFPL